MKKTIPLLGLCLSLALTGCASLLERSYEVSTPHVEKPSTVEDSSSLRVETYHELVSAVLYLVSQGTEEGSIRLYDYPGDPAADVAAACVEVAEEDPLGAYAVSDIRHEVTPVLSYHQATLTIHYRRTAEQIASIEDVTGTTAIRERLQTALASFDGEVALRTAYFFGDAASIEELIRQAYYDTPGSALGMPQTSISLYPDSGTRRVVEIALTYPEGEDALWEKSNALFLQARELAGQITGTNNRETALSAHALLRDRASYSGEGGSTAYDALVEGSADSEGLALSYALLCRRAGLTCDVVEGQRQGEPAFWNELTAEDGLLLYADPTHQTPGLYTAEDMAALGYQWEGGPEAAEG